MLKRVRLFTILVALTIVGGFAFELIDPWAEPITNLHFIFNWTLGSCLFWGFQVFFIPSRWGEPLRRMFFLTAILAKSLILVGVVVFTVIAHQLLLHGGLHPHFFTHPEFYIITAFVLLLVAIIQAVSQDRSHNRWPGPD